MIRPQVAPAEFFPALQAHDAWVAHAFLGRAPGIDVTTDRRTALDRLALAHDAARIPLGLDGLALLTAEQVHGNGVACAIPPEDPTIPAPPAPGADALVADHPGIILGIYVADCCPVYLLDPRNRSIGLAHAGRRGAELGIVPATIAAMRDAFGTRPEDLVIQLGPCIRPPHYETDFAALIRQQCREAGARQVRDCGICTASHPERYYSYRRERGRTGRMLALLAIRVV